jgi:hypothetical protein
MGSALLFIPAQRIPGAVGTSEYQFPATAGAVGANE